jgi:diadenosine tetraphosphatase ApaH/serine/threonine PP2A family protein phosphatase
MKRALISDIHGNLEALEAVIADIEKRAIEEVYFLGDLVGYGPDSEACVDIVSARCQLHLMGNHDHALLTAAVGFNRIAKKAIDCLREQMRPGEDDGTRKARRWEYLTGLERVHEEVHPPGAGKFLYVHASPREPVYEYVLETDAIFGRDKLGKIFARMKRLCFVGHTHVPGVMTDEPRWHGVKELDYQWQFTPGKQIVNLGSVGQPRDRDPRASYLEVNDDGCRWHRVEYDIEAVIAKVRASDSLDDHNGLRLLRGR